MSLQQILRTYHQQRVPMPSICSCFEQPVHSLSINPKKHVCIDDAVPVLGTHVVSQGAFKTAVVHRFLITQDRNAVRVVSYWDKLPSIAAFNRPSLRTVHAK